MSRPMHAAFSDPASWTTACNLDRANVHWTTDQDQVTCLPCRRALGVPVPGEPQPVSLESQILSIVAGSDWFREQQERVYDEAVRAVANVDPQAVHNPYRKES